MIKKILFSLVIISLGYFAQQKAVSYNAYDNRYNYNENSSMPSSSHYSNMNGEDILIIVDFSESMNKSFGISTRYIQAVDALSQILREMPQNTRVGLRIFGIPNTGIAEFDTNNDGRVDRNEVCRATKLVMPIRANNASNISTELSAHTPNGVTPIGYSLRQAINNDFPNPSALKHIILVTDGRENCGDDPCLYINNLMRTRKDIKIDVIGITIDENAYSQLSCIANSAYGKYYDANNPGDLKIQFRNAFVNATTSYKPVGFSSQSQSVIPQTNTLENTSGIKYTNYSFEFDI